MRKHATARGVGGMPPPRKFLEFRGYEIASETIFGPKRCFSEARRQSSIRMNSYPFCPLRQIAAFHSLISQAIYPSQMRLVRLIVRLEEQKVVGRLGRDSFALFAAISYYVLTYYHAVCVPWAFASTGPIWRRQASHGGGPGKVVRLKPD